MCTMKQCMKTSKVCAAETTFMAPCRWGYWGYGDTYGRPENEAAYRATLSTSMNFWDTGQPPLLCYFFCLSTKDSISCRQLFPLYTCEVYSKTTLYGKSPGALHCSSHVFLEFDIAHMSSSLVKHFRAILVLFVKTVSACRNLTTSSNSW